ncbi:MAG: transglycosylase domain-containing protein [Verrucomicrobiota bacterium]
MKKFLASIPNNLTFKKLLRQAKKLPLWIIIPTGLIISLPALFFFYYFFWALFFDLDEVSHMPATSIIYDRNGYVMQRVYEQHRILVKAEQIPKQLKQALIAREDERFYWHPGFDPFSIVRAIASNYTSGRVVSGASTITQQLARNSAGINAPTLDRKLKELFLALRIELAYSKDEILLYYFNRVFFGSHLYGIGSASDAYFGKKPQDLNLSESAMLVGIIAGPNLFSPWKNPEQAKKVRDFTLDRMATEGFISSEEASKTKAKPLILRPRINIPGSYAVHAIMNTIPSYLTRRHIYRGGLHIHTSIDLAFQKSAEQEMEKQLVAIESRKGYKHMTRHSWQKKHGNTPNKSSQAPPYLQGSFVAIRNVDGAILSLVGGRSYEESSYNRALFAERQIGSTVKPLLYAHAFNVLNCSAFTKVNAEPFDLKNPFKEYRKLPRSQGNYQTIRKALATSNNYSAVRSGIYSGLDSLSFFLGHVFEREVPALPSSCLGAFEMSPLALTSAYTLFPNYGIQIKPHLITKIETSDKQTLYGHIDDRRRVLSPQISFQVIDMMQSVVDEGSARSLRSTWKIKGPFGGKTGTTNDYKDSWFIGFNSEITAGAWVGLDKPQTIIPSGYSSRIAVPTWGRIMKIAQKHYPARDFPPPPGLIQVKKIQEKGFWIFKKKQIVGRSEYVREEQKDNMLLLLSQEEIEDLKAYTYRTNRKTLTNRIKKWLGWQEKRNEQDFAVIHMPSPEEQASINDNIKTEAPRAEAQ